jgi:PAS domain S-box-containing protein
MTVRVLKGVDRITISVADNGVGIPPENLDRIFNHGFTTRKGGHGYGLHSCANAAREMGGALSAHSDGPGQGATFVLELPIGAASTVVALLRDDLPNRTRAQERVIQMNSEQEQRVLHRMAELERSKAALMVAQRIGQIGNWEFNLLDQKLSWSPEIFRIFEIDPEQFGASYESFLQTIHPEDRTAVDAAYTASLQSRQPYEITHRLLLPDGRIKHVHELGETHYDESGRAIRTIGTVQDITRRKHAEEISRRLANIVESSNDAIISETLDGIVTSWNHAAEKIFGYTAAEIIGQSVTVLIPPDRAMEERDILDHIAEGDEAYQVETRRVRKDGMQIDVVATVSPIKDAQGKIVGASKIGRDITRRKQAEAELEQTHNQLLEVSRLAGMAEFATGVLHNVGNVLNSVNTASVCLAQSLEKSKTANLGKLAALIRAHESDLGAFFTSHPQGKLVPNYLATLADHLTGEQAKALKELAELQKRIEHIKEMVRMQQSSAKVCGTAERLSVTELMDDALAMNANGLERSHIQVVKEFAEIPPVVVEKHKVLQILVNLVRNAMQACDGVESQDKRLSAQVSRNNGCVRIAVTDTGCGIRPENLGKIFAHGFTTKKDGHGFGLHSARLAAKEMGGSLSAQSDGPGQGATFVLELPCDPDKSNS